MVTSVHTMESLFIPGDEEIANPGFGLGNHLEAVLVDIRLRFPGIQENLCVVPENTIAAPAIFLAI